MRFDEFEVEFPGHLASVKASTVRSWKKRGSVPDSVATALRVAKHVPTPVASVANPVALPVATGKSVASSVAKADATPSATPPALQVLVPSAEAGHPEFDIMGDGWARGFPGDGWQRTHRTAHAIRRFGERDGFDVRSVTQEFWDGPSKSLEGRVAFFRRLGGVK